MSDSEEERYGEEEEVEQNISSSSVMQKFRVAGSISDEAIKLAIRLCQDGARVAEICEACDNFIREETGKLFPRQKTIMKGLAFPTCLSINNIVSHFSPFEDDETILRTGDVVKIDLGVQVDKFPALAATTTVVGFEQERVTGRKADLLAATEAVAKAAARLVRVGNKSSDLGPVLAKIAESFQCNLVEGVLSHNMGRGVLDGEQVILLKPTPTQSSAEFTFEANSVFHIDLVLSTGEGKPKDIGIKSTVFKKTDVTYSLRIKASRTLFKEVNQKIGPFGFSLRGVESKNARLGINECVQHGLVHAYPVLAEKDGEFVAQIKFTVLIQPTGTARITQFPLPSFTSEHKIQDAEITALLNSAESTNKKKKKKQKKKKSAAGGAGSSSA